jgi:hypothetical protein
MKLKKDTKLLSFGEDAEGDDDADASEPAAAQNGRRGGIRSAHDVWLSLHRSVPACVLASNPLRRCCISQCPGVAAAHEATISSA